MKIAILTINSFYNYGNRLQNFALHTFLKSLNSNIEVETMWCDKNRHKKERIYFVNKVYDLLTNMFGDFSKKCFNKYKRQANLKLFTDKYIKTSYEYGFKDELDNWNSPKLQNRVVSITNVTTDKSNIGRLSVWESSINMIKDHPITGVGLRQFKEQYYKKYDLKRVKFYLPHSHNNFLQIFAEAGIIGFLGFLTFTLFVLWDNFTDWIRNRNPYSLMMFALWAGFTGFGLIDATIYGSSASRTVWLLTGMLLVLRVEKSSQ